MAGSSLLIDEFFETGDPRFVGEVVASRDSAKLKSLAARWYADQRSFARQALFTYFEDVGADTPWHRPLVKALFKAAEQANDDALMGALMVAFDRFALRRLTTRYAYDFKTRAGHDVTELKNAKGLTGRLHDPKDQKAKVARFTVVTRRYLQRRAWRYFRKLAWRDEERYRNALSEALKRYGEDTLATSVQLVDAWGLMNALYHGAPALERKTMGFVVAEGKSLQDLAPAPYRAELWSNCLDLLLDLFLSAHSNAVRQWAVAVLRRDYTEKVRRLPMAKVRLLLKHPAAEAQQLGAELLKHVEGLEQLPVSDWLALLAIDNQDALPVICELLQKHVSPDRLTLAHCIELARSPVAPVAELGLKWARQKPVRDEADLDVLGALTSAKVPSVRRPGIEWLASLLLLNEGPKLPERVRELIDSRFGDVREQGLTLMKKDQRFGSSTLLWSAMAESPWPEVRETLVPTLREREAHLPAGSLHWVWATTLLAVRRGYRAKRTALLQLANRIVRSPHEADTLLPLLAVALRSVRGPERRAAMASLGVAATRVPSLQAKLTAAVPELTFLPGAAF